jgi:hypothetical protein
MCRRGRLTIGQRGTKHPSPRPRAAPSRGGGPSRVRQLALWSTLLWGTKIRISTKAEAGRPQLTSRRDPDVTFWWLTLISALGKLCPTPIDTDAHLEQNAVHLQLVKSTTKIKS